MKPCALSDWDILDGYNGQVTVEKHTFFNRRIGIQPIPSGYVKHSDIEDGPVEIVDLPTENGDVS